MTAPNYLNKVYLYVAIAIVVCALIGATLAFLPKISLYQDYQDKCETYKAEIAEEKERIEELQLNQEKFRTDKRFVQKIAHEIGFAHEGETIYQFDQPVTNSGVQTE